MISLNKLTFNVPTVLSMYYACNRCSLLAKLLKEFFSIVILRVMRCNKNFETITRPINSFGLTYLNISASNYLYLSW